MTSGGSSSQEAPGLSVCEVAWFETAKEPSLRPDSKQRARDVAWWSGLVVRQRLSPGTGITNWWSVPISSVFAVILNCRLVAEMEK